MVTVGRVKLTPKVMFLWSIESEDLAGTDFDFDTIVAGLTPGDCQPKNGRNRALWHTCSDSDHGHMKNEEDKILTLGELTITPVKDINNHLLEAVGFSGLFFRAPFPAKVRPTGVNALTSFIVSP
jgi:hypothetical protein